MLLTFLMICMAFILLVIGGLAWKIPSSEDAEANMIGIGFMLIPFLFVFLALLITAAS